MTISKVTSYVPVPSPIPPVSPTGAYLDATPWAKSSVAIPMSVTSDSDNDDGGAPDQVGAPSRAYSVFRSQLNSRIDMVGGRYCIAGLDFLTDVNIGAGRGGGTQSANNINFTILEDSGRVHATWWRRLVKMGQSQAFHTDGNLTPIKYSFEYQTGLTQAELDSLAKSFQGQWDGTTPDMVAFIEQVFQTMYDLPTPPSQKTLHGIYYPTKPNATVLLLPYAVMDKFAITDESGGTYEIYFKYFYAKHKWTSGLLKTDVTPVAISVCEPEVFAFELDMDANGGKGPDLPKGTIFP